MADNIADIDGAAAMLTIIALLADKKRKSRHFSHVHATLWLAIEQCSNRRRNLVPDETDIRSA